jgi:hypothetical protein
MARPKVLFVTSELFPEFGYPTAGGGVRGQQVFRSLEAAGYPVELALARFTAEGKDLPEWASRFPYRPEFLDGTIEQADPDVVLGEGWEPLSHCKFEDSRLYVADCPGPLVLENAHREVGDLRSNTHHKVRTLSRLDAVLCPNRAMRCYLGGFLTLAGWRPGQSGRIVQVPISLPEKLPERRSPENLEGEVTIFTGGVSWAWHRASPWVLRLADELERVGFGKIRVRLGKHPHHTPEGVVYEELDPSLENHPRICTEGLTDWDALVEELSAIPLAVEWSPKHLEREIASTLRIVTYLWCGVPAIVPPHLDLAGEIREYQAGWVAENWDEMVRLLEGPVRDSAELKKRSENARRLARERHSWPTCHAELVGCLEALGPRDKPPSFLSHATEVFRSQEEELHRLREERKHLDEEFARVNERLQASEQDAEAFRGLRQKLPYKIWKKIAG